MKKLILAATASLFMLPGSSAGQSSKKILVAYFSHSGNTRTVAEQIQRATGADLFEIKAVKPYPTAYQAVVDQAKKEVNAGFRPALKETVKDLGQYDIVFIGSPCWWYTIAPAVASFLASGDFSGKTIVPFMTHEGSRFANSLDDIRKLCPDAKLAEGLPVRGSSVKSAQPEVEKWLKRIGIIQ